MKMGCPTEGVVWDCWKKDVNSIFINFGKKAATVQVNEAADLFECGSVKCGSYMSYVLKLGQ